jgi:hypothetical protein
MLRLDSDGPDILVFLPGFMSPAESYCELLAPLADAGTTVIAPQLYRRDLDALRGKVRVGAEARAAADLVLDRAEPGIRVYLAGHSRGGQAAWRAAGMLGEGVVAGVCLIDPVDGHTRRPKGPVSTRRAAGFTCRSMIVGAGVGGRCAPAGVDHRQFAAATPQAAHVVIEDMGHADMLSGVACTVGRLLCGGGEDPDAARRLCTRLITSFLLEDVPEPGPHGGFRRLR